MPSGGSKTQLPCASAPAVVKGPKLEVSISMSGCILFVIFAALLHIKCSL